MWHICYRLPLSLSKLLEFRIFLLEELPDCWKRKSLVFKRTNRDSVFFTSMVRHFLTLCHSVSFEIIVKRRTQMSPGIRRELSMPCFQFLNIWHMHFFFFAFIFLNFYLLKKKTARAVKRHVGLILTRSGFQFCLMNSFYRSPILLCYSAIQVSVSCWVRGYFVKNTWCGIGAEWDIKLINWVNKSQFTPKMSHKLTFEFSPSPLWSSQSESNLFSANGECSGESSPLETQPSHKW